MDRLESTVDYRGQQKKLKKKRKKFKRAVFWIKFILVLATCLVIVVSLAFSPFCNITSIEVQKSQHYKQDDIINATDLVVGTNGFKALFRNLGNIRDFFWFRFGLSEQDIMRSHPYFKDVEVKYVIPGSVKIDFTERAAIFFIPYLGTNLLIDSEGYVVDTIQDSKVINLPEIKGIVLEGYQLGKSIHPTDNKSAENATRVIMTIENSDKKESFKLKDVIKSIDVSDSSRICLFIDNRLEVNMGGMDDLDYKIDFLRQIYFKKLKKEDKGLLDFSTGDKPNFIPEKK